MRAYLAQQRGYGARRSASGPQVSRACRTRASMAVAGGGRRWFGDPRDLSWRDRTWAVSRPSIAGVERPAGRAAADRWWIGLALILIVSGRAAAVVARTRMRPGIAFVERERGPLPPMRRCECRREISARATGSRCCTCSDCRCEVLRARATDWLVRRSAGPRRRCRSAFAAGSSSVEEGKAIEGSDIPPPVLARRRAPR